MESSVTMQMNVVSGWPMGAEGGTLQEPGIRPGGRRKGRSARRTGTKRGRPRRKTAPWDSQAMMRAVEALSKLVTPQVMLPTQLKSEPEDLPEFGLLRAVLLSAVVEYVDSFKPSPNLEVAQRRREARQVAESWFAGDPGAAIEFELCCSMFGVSADRMREKIRQLTRRLTAPWN
jgi:hypothetical protein